LAIDPPPQAESMPIDSRIYGPRGIPSDSITAERALGQPVIVENVTGAAGSIGVGKVVRAVPDGYTLSTGDIGNYITNQALYSLQYDLRTDLQPIALTRVSAYLIFARQGLPANNLSELVGWLRANPGKALAGTGGVGSGDHLAGIMFENSTGTRIQFVPYRGEAPAVQDLIAGQIDLVFAGPVIPLPLAKAGRIKAYAVMGARRLQAAPDIPTVDEAGVQGAYYVNWSAIWAPKGTPKEVVAKLNAAIVDALADPKVRARLADLGTDVPPREHQTPEWLGAFHKAEFEKWMPIIKAAGIKPE
jgi:tripartite-type tricarboxylate transporter receptor subunit TctC